MTGQVPVVDFFSSWDNYRAVIDSDAMEHRAIYQAVHNILMDRPTAFSLIDLGCGDAAGTAPALVGTMATHYVGVDIAAPALGYAAHNLEGSLARVDLRVADVMEALANPHERFDIILACFVVHHLASAEKHAFLERCHERLSDGGELLLIDLVRADGTTREDFLKLQDARIRTWPIGHDLQERTVAHANGFDFPEEESTLPTWAREAGFGEIVAFYRGGDGTQVGWRMQR